MLSTNNNYKSNNQVTALLRRMLPELPPPVFASLVGVDVLPTTDYGILQVLNSTGSIERYFTKLIVFITLESNYFIIT